MFARPSCWLSKRMRLSASLFGASVLLCQTAMPSGAIAQSVPAAANAQFEVASIHLSKDPRPLGPIDLALLHAVAEHARDGHFQLNGVPTSVLIELAYDLKDFQVKGLPEWASSQEYQVNARAGSDQTFEQMRPMLRSLLEERFGLRFHSDSAQANVLDLEVAKGGLKITAAASGSCITLDPNQPPPPRKPGSDPAPLHICGGKRFALRPDHSKELEAVGITMPALATVLSDEVGQLVVDETKLAGTFDLRLQFTPSEDGPLPTSGSEAVASSAPSIFTALQEQIGLRLQPAKQPVKVLVIDHVARPTEN